MDLVEKISAHLSLALSSLLSFNPSQVYFIWVARDQRQFEWLSEIIERAEQTSDMLSAHVFITQIPHKFDLRTTMLVRL